MNLLEDNQKELERKCRDFLLSMGFDLTDEMKETPRRIVDLYRDMNEGTKIDIKKFFDRPLPTKHKSMIVIKDIEFVSWCCHHFWPFFGKVHVAYIPNGKIVGLSKFISAVRAISKRPQIQEGMNKELADVIDESLQPLGVMVIVEGRHTCMMVGGKYDYGFPANTDSKTITSEVRGVMLNFEPPRNEAMKLIYG